MSIPASDSQHEFRVDRPGRYRTRSGRDISVLSTAGMHYDPQWQWRSNDALDHVDWLASAWRNDGSFAISDVQHPNDLIAYIGPLECDGSHMVGETSSNCPQHPKSADPAISDAAWKAYDVNGIDRGVCERFYAKHGIVWRTREEWERQGSAMDQCDVLQAKLTAAREEIAALQAERDTAWLKMQEADYEIDRLTKELDDEWDLLREYMRVETLGEVILPKKRPAKAAPRPSIPLTTLTTEHYLSPLLGGERAR